MSPIVIFCYKRKAHIEKLIASLLLNQEAHESDLVIFSDGARGDRDANEVEEVRQYIHGIKGFKSVKINCRDSNYGLSLSIISGVTELFQVYSDLIVLEDDLVVSPFFLRYMNDALIKYEADESVICIHGYRYPIFRNQPKSYMLKGADCWGWGTWRRAWPDLNISTELLLNELIERNLGFQFNYQGGINYLEMLAQQRDGVIDSWAIKWHAWAFLRNCFTLYPSRNLVINSGSDGSGTHKAFDSRFLDRNFATNPVEVEILNAADDLEVLREIKYLFELRNSMLNKSLRKIKSFFSFK